MTKVKTIIVGIDGLSWGFVDPLMDAGRVPALARLIDAGGRAIVKSTVPTISPVAWSSFITGLLPVRHRVLDWYARSPGGGRRPVTSRDRHGVPFWEYLNRAGIRTGVMNLPATFPAGTLDGFMTSGFDAPHGSVLAAYPETLAAEVRSRFGAEVLEHPSQSLVEQAGPQVYASAYMRHDQRLTEAAVALSREHQVEVLVLNYQTVDHFNHHLPDARYIDDALVNIDACLAQLGEAFPGATWILMSDHGSRRTSRAFLLVDWLEHEGFVVLDRRGLQGAAAAGAVAARVRAGGRTARVLGALVNRVARRLPAATCERLVRGVTGGRPMALWPVPFIDRAHSAVSAVSPGTCGFYLADGAAGTGAAERRGQLVERLRCIRDPRDATPLFAAVHTRDELFGECDWADLPDVIAVSAEADARPVSTTLYPDHPDHCFVPSTDVHYYGGHTLDGIGAFAGAEFAARPDSYHMNLWDLPGIILHLHGVPIPENFDGIVPVEIFAEPFRAANPMRAQAPAPSAAAGAEGGDDAEVTERLRALGYL